MFDVAKGIYLDMHTNIRTEVTGVSRPFTLTPDIPALYLMA
jgi:hypothetical protein